MPRGGKRPNAGRKKKYGPGFRIALLNDFCLLQAQHPRWKTEDILDELERQGKIDMRMSRGTLKRMVETRYVKIKTREGEVNIREVLTTARRDGILAALPTLEKKN
jgi:hypothetical protein